MSYQIKDYVKGQIVSVKQHIPVVEHASTDHQPYMYKTQAGERVMILDKTPLYSEPFNLKYFAKLAGRFGYIIFDAAYHPVEG